MSYYGGWHPADYITGDVPIKNAYKRKNGKEYMDIKEWADGKWDDEDERNKQLRGVYLSARIMKYHPLMTKELRKTYSMLANAAMRAMSPEYKYAVKQEFNPVNSAIKKMRAEQKLIKAKYGPVAKR